MADFYPVLKRAVAALPAGSTATRQTVYNRARMALDRQLAGYQPALPDSEIEAQRAALDRAISQVEAELEPAAANVPAAISSPALLPQPPERAPAPAVQRPVPEQAARTEKPAREIRLRKTPVSAGARADGLPPVPRTPSGMLLAEPRSLSDFAHGTPATDVQAPAKKAEPVPAASPDVVPADAGKAAAKGKRSGFWPRHAGLQHPETETPAAAAPDSPAQGTGRINVAAVAERLPAVAPVPAFDVWNALADAAGSGKAPEAAEAADAHPGVHGDGRILLHGEPGTVHKVVAAIKNPLIFSLFAMALLVAVLGTAGWMQRDQLVQWFHPAAFGTAGVSVTDATNDGLGPKFEDKLPPDDSLNAPAPDVRSVATEKVSPGTEAAVASAAPVPGAAPGAATVTYGTDSAASSYTTRSTAETGPAAAAQPPAATADGAAQPATPLAALASIDTNAQAAASVQQAVFYEEALPGVRPVPVKGTAKWSLVNEPALPGDPPVPQVRLDVAFPERDLKLTLYIRANRDESVPISHFVDMQFAPGPAFPERGVQMVLRMIMKPTEQARGEILGGVVTQVVDNRFWLALSADRDTRAHNVDLMRTQGWIDIPVLFTDRRRGLIAIEKGDAGTAAVNNGFASFGG